MRLLQTVEISSGIQIPEKIVVQTQTEGVTVPAVAREERVVAEDR
jgi:hypothetical protein